MVAKIITPKLRFAAALNGYDDRAAKKIGLEIERCVMNGKIWVSRAVTAGWLLNIGVKNHPGFIRDMEAIQFRRRRLRKVARADFLVRQEQRKRNQEIGLVQDLAGEGDEEPYHGERTTEQKGG